jgi:hypothetical protein
LNQLETETCEDEIRQSLLVAIQRVELNFKNIDLTISEISKEFNYVLLKDVIEAIRLGSFGKYGITYKLTTQTVSFWIREYLKSNKKPLLL